MVGSGTQPTVFVLLFSSHTTLFVSSRLMDSSHAEDATNTKSASAQDKPLSTQVAQLQVSESSPQEQESSRSPEPKHPHDIADDISTGSDSSEDETHRDTTTPRQELGLVISALQNTVQKSTPENPPHQDNSNHEQQQQQQQPSATDIGKEKEEDHSKINGNHAEELHSGDDDEHTTVSEQSEYDESSSRDGSMGEIVPPTPGTPPPIFEPRTSDDLPDVEAYSSANLIALHDINLKDIKANNLSPREQEKAGKWNGVGYHFIVYDC